MTLRPTTREVGEHRQHRQFIIVIPKNERIVPEQKKTEEDDDKSCRYRARNFRTRGARSGHLTQKTPNPQRPTPNVELRGSAYHLAFSQPSGCWPRKSGSALRLHRDRRRSLQVCRGSLLDLQVATSA